MEENLTLSKITAQAVADDRAIRRALGKLTIRVIEKLESELLSGRTHTSTSAALAREIRGASEYLESLMDRINKVTPDTGPQEVEKLLTRLNELTGRLQRLRAPRSEVVSAKVLARRKGMRTRVPAGALVEGAAVEKKAPSRKRPRDVPQDLPEAQVGTAPAEGIVPEGGTDGTCGHKNPIDVESKRSNNNPHG